MDKLIVSMAVIAGYLLVLGFGGIVADYVFPRIKPLADWVDGLVQEKADWAKAIQESNRTKT